MCFTRLLFYDSFRSWENPGTNERLTEIPALANQRAEFSTRYHSLSQRIKKLKKYEYSK